MATGNSSVPSKTPGRTDARSRASTASLSAIHPSRHWLDCLPAIMHSATALQTIGNGPRWNRERTEEPHPPAPLQRRRRGILLGGQAFMPDSRRPGSPTTAAFAVVGVGSDEGA